MASLQSMIKFLGLESPEKIKLLDPANQKKIQEWLKKKEADVNTPRVSTAPQTLKQTADLGELNERLRVQQGENNLVYGEGVSSLYGDTRDRDSLRRQDETAANLGAYTDSFMKMQGVPYGTLMQEAQQADAVGLDKVIAYHKGRDSQDHTQAMLARLLQGAGTLGVIFS